MGGTATEELPPPSGEGTVVLDVGGPYGALVVLAPLLLYSWYEARQGLATVEGVDAAHTRAVRALGYGVPPR